MVVVGVGTGHARIYYGLPGRSSKMPLRGDKPVFSSQEGVCRVLGGMLQPLYRPRPRTSTPFPGAMNGWHHVASFLETSTVVPPRFFVQKNYGAGTDIARGHSFRLLRQILTPTENAPLARKNLSLFQIWKNKVFSKVTS